MEECSRIIKRPTIGVICDPSIREHCNRVWKIKDQGGQMKDKKRGQCAMVAAFCCAPIGLWIDSMKLITPGANGIDPWCILENMRMVHLRS